VAEEAAAVDAEDAADTDADADAGFFRGVSNDGSERGFAAAVVEVVS